MYVKVVKVFSFLKILGQSYLLDSFYLIWKLSKNNFFDFLFLRPSQSCARGGRPSRPTLATALLDRTSSVPMSVLRLLVDKGQGLRSGILCFTSVVLPPKGMLSRELKIILFRCWWLSWIKSMSLFINIFNSFILDWHKYKGFSSRFSLEGHTNIKYLLYVDLSSSMKNSWNDYSFTLIAKKC